MTNASDGRGKRWLPLEANPEVMTSYARGLGSTVGTSAVSGAMSSGLPSFLHFTDVLSVEDWALDMVPQPVVAVVRGEGYLRLACGMHGFQVLLFPIKDSTEEDDKGRIEAVKKEEIPAAVQSCEEGLIHCMANMNGKVGVEYGEPIVDVDKIGTGWAAADNSYIAELLNNTKSMTPDERAVYIEEDDKLEKAHRQVPNQTRSFTIVWFPNQAEHQGQSRPPAEDESVNTHFVAFVVVDGKLLELDGRKPSPIPHGKCSEDQVLQRTVDVVKNVFMKRDPDEIRFNILALTAGESSL